MKLFKVKTKEICKSMPSVVSRWKSFYKLRKYFKKVEKTFARECKLLVNGRKVVHVDMNS